MVLWAVVIIGDKINVQVYDGKNKYVKAVFASKVGACECARYMARIKNLTYIGAKVRAID